jgi:L-asparagine transporter-like permease
VTFEWSWFAFIIGIVATLTIEFWLIIIVAVSQYKKQKQQAKASWDNVDKLFQAWGGKDAGN